MPSTVVRSGAVASSMLWRRFWPVSEMTLSRLAAGLKSIPNWAPESATLSWETLTAWALAVLSV
ncbi:hypothetical protein GCM10020254_06830 [Streptomyces goshikiensis]